MHITDKKKTYLKRTAITILVVITLYGITGFLILPPLLKTILPEKLAPLLKRDVQIEQIKLNPFALSVTVIGFEVGGKNGQPLLSFGRLYANIQLSSIIRRAIVMDMVQLEAPHLFIARNQQGGFNFSDILDHAPADATPPKNEPAPKSAAAPVIFDIAQVILQNGQVDYSDQTGQAPFKTRLSPIDLKITNLCNRPNQTAQYSLTVTTEISERLDLHGTVNLTPLQARGQIALKQVDLKKYDPFYSNLTGFVLDQGKLDIQTEYHYQAAHETADSQLTLAPALALHQLVLKDPQTGEVFTRLPQIDISDTTVDLAAKDIRIGKVTATEGYLRIDQSRDQGLNLTRLFTLKTQQTASPAVSPQKVTPPTTQKDVPRPQAAPAQSNSPAWQATLNQCVFHDYRIDFNDLSPQTPVHITAGGINLTAKAFSTRNNHPGHVALNLKINNTGTLAINGPITLTPLSGQLKVNSDAIDMRMIQPYLDEQLNLLLVSGLIKNQGRIEFKQSKDHGISAQYKGSAALTDLVTADKDHTQDFIKLGALDLAGIDVQYQPLQIAVDTITFLKPYAHVIVNQDRSVNINRIFRTEPSKKSDGGTSPQSPAPTETASNPIDIKIETVAIKDGQFLFSDQSVHPAYRTRMDQLNGQITGISSMRRAYADVSLTGQLDSHSPLSVKGKINPLIKTPYIDLAIRWNNIELSPFTPYSGKYLGYVLEKGKLSLGLDYKIEKNQLSAQNKVIFDQLTLGGSVSSKEATALPIPLALALLTDRHGNIDLNVPIQGNLNDPKFSLTETIVQTLVNLITKVATSPFSALSSVFGDGTELNHLEYAPGSDAVEGANAAKLDILKKALYERPQLKLEIEGIYDAKADRQALQERDYLDLLRAQKRKQRIAEKKQAPPLEKITITPDERPRLIEAAYKSLRSARKEIIDQKDPQRRRDQMKQALIDSIDVTTDRLRILAQTRASNVKDYILTDVKVSADRLFILEPGSMSDSDQAGTQSRVIFALK